MIFSFNSKRTDDKKGAGYLKTGGGGQKAVKGVLVG